MILVCSCVMWLVPMGYGQADRVSQLIEKLNDRDSRVRLQAVGDLERIGALAVEHLITALKHADWNVRERAAEALGEIKDPRAVEPLIATLEDADSRVRSSVAKALGEIKDPRAVEPLFAALADGDISIRVTWSAAMSLRKIGAPVVELLIAALKDPDSRVRRSAAYALGEIEHPRAVEALLAGLRELDLALIAGAYAFFIRRGEPGSEDALIRALNAHTTKEMAEDLRYCGNSALEAAAREWMVGRDLSPSAKHGDQGEPLRWGSRR